MAKVVDKYKRMHSNLQEVADTEKAILLSIIPDTF